MEARSITIQRNGESTALSYAEGGQAEGTPVVCVHGWLDSWKSFTPITSALCSSRKVFSLSLRGWGDSSKHGPFTIETYAADVVGFLKALNIGPVILLGHSMGTIISTLVASMHPSLVSGLILIGAAASMNGDHVVDPDEGLTLAGVLQLVETHPGTLHRDSLPMERFVDSAHTRSIL